MDVQLGNRVTLTFVAGEGESMVYSICQGDALSVALAAPEGYAWSTSQSEVVAPVFSSVSTSTTYYLVKI